MRGFVMTFGQQSNTFPVFFTLQTQITASADLCAVTWKDSGEKKCTRE